MLLLSGLAYGNQFLLNPDFETGSMAPWINDNTYQAGSWAVLNSGCESGTFCLTETGNVGLEQTFGAIGTGAITSITFWVHPDSVTPSQGITTALIYTGGTDYQSINPAHGTWDLVNLTPFLRSSGTLVGIEVFGYSGYSVEVDNFSLLATAPEPGAFWLLAGGLGVLLAAARLKSNARREGQASR
jgi:hypothetical protein